MTKRNNWRYRKPSTDTGLDPVVLAADARLARVVRIYEGSDGDATQGLYKELTALGPTGIVATNLFRAQKNSARAKVYKGGGYSGMAYDRKNWAMGNLDAALTEHAGRLGITWGWASDPAQAKHSIVLYVDTPSGQVSFHTETRGAGKDYSGKWDGVRGDSAKRVCRWCASLLGNSAPVAPRNPGAWGGELSQTEIWIVQGEDSPSNLTGERQIHQFSTLEAAHEAGFTWAK